MAKDLHIVCPTCDTINRIPSARINDGPACGKCYVLLFSSQTMELKIANFQKHITRNSIPIMVDFWASWCGPCKIMALAFEEAGRELEACVRLAKVNREHEQSIGSRFTIRSIPTMILFHNGQDFNRHFGTLAMEEIVHWTHAKL